MEREKEIISMLDGELDEEKKSNFIALIENDKELLNDKEIYEKIIEGIKNEADTHLKNDLNEYLKDYLNENSKTKVVDIFQKPMTYISIAASLLVGLFFINFYAQDQNDPIILRSKDVPVKLDSAIYNPDSLSKPIKKNIE